MANSHKDINDQLLAVMEAALGDNPLTAGLAVDQRRELAIRALREGRAQDATWLAAAVATYQEADANVAETLFSAENSVTETISSETISSEKKRVSEAAGKRAGAQGGAPLAAGAVPLEGGTPAKPVIEIAISRPQLIQSQADLEAVLEAHTAWIKQVLEPGLDLGSGRANLKGNDLRPYQLEGRDLRAANLEGCDLRELSLVACNLAGANLSRTKLNGACLDGARLRRSNLNAADLSGASLRGADLRHAQLNGTKFEGADLTGTHLENRNAPPRPPAEALPTEA